MCWGQPAALRSGFEPGMHLGTEKKKKKKKKRGSRRIKKEMESRLNSDQDSTLMLANTLYKEEGRPIPNHAKFL
jgi:hypothetical protein